MVNSKRLREINCTHSICSDGRQQKSKGMQHCYSMCFQRLYSLIDELKFNVSHADSTDLVVFKNKNQTVTLRLYFSVSQKE